MPMDPDELQRRTRWLRGLARQLIGDPTRGDDIAQEAWLVALRRERPASFGSHPWLAGIVRNLVWRARPATPAFSSRSRG